MNEDFVSFELAKKLKEKGFPQYTEKSYFVGDHKKRMCSVGTFLHVHTQNTAHLIAAPTISQVLKWLREKGIFIEIHVHATFATKNKVAYWCRICRNSNGVSIEQIDELEAAYADYEKAAMGGIEYCLDNLI